MKRKIVVVLSTGGRIVKASCWCGERHARMAVGGWKVPWYRSSNEVLVDRSIAQDWIVKCGCMRLKTPRVDP